MTTPPESRCGRALEAEREEFVRVFTEHVAREIFAARFSTPVQLLRHECPPSAFRDYLAVYYTPLPDAVINAAGYRDLLAAMREHGSNAIAEFRYVRRRGSLGGRA